MKSIQQRAGQNMTTAFDFSIPEQKILDTYTCSGCGYEVEIVEAPIAGGPNKGEVITKERGCNCELIIKIHEEQKKARLNRLQKTFEENSLLNPALAKATFDNFDPGEFTVAYEQAIKFVEHFNLENPCNLLFQGSFGTGKSHLAVSIAKALQQEGYTTIFISTPKLLTKIRNTYNKESDVTEAQIIRSLLEADLVVFDDVGSEGDINGWGMQKLFEVIDDRAGKHNVFTTNLNSKDFNQNKDLQRLFSRMMMDVTPIVMNGTDYRRRKFAK